MNAERDRDRLLENALKLELGAAGVAPATAACLDAETMAAWTDGGLDQTSIAMAEAHASNCARCQALLGSIARTTPAVAVAEPRTARLWRWWFAPLAATTAAVAVWMVVPQDQFTAPPTPTAVAELAGPKEQLAKPDADVGVTQSAPAAVPLAAAPPADLRAPGKDRADAAPPARDEARKRKAETLEVQERKAEEPKLADTAAAGRAAGVAAAPAAPPAASSPAPPAPPAAALRKQAEQFVEDQATARSSPSSNVIWIVGRAGMVMLATDGRTFLRVPFPETADLTAVTAEDERRAVVTTADGRVFETADGGRTWRLRQ